MLRAFLAAFRAVAASLPGAPALCVIMFLTYMQYEQAYSMSMFLCAEKAQFEALPLLPSPTLTAWSNKLLPQHQLRCNMADARLLLDHQALVEGVLCPAVQRGVVLVVVSIGLRKRVEQLQ